MKRGRPFSIDPTKLYEVLLKHKDGLYNDENGTVLAKHDPLWQDISNELVQVSGVKKSALALHAHVLCRKVFSTRQPTVNIVYVSIKKTKPNCPFLGIYTLLL